MMTGSSNEMGGARRIALQLGLVAAAGGLLSGCVAQVAHAVFSPALTAASEASQTPESVGITTSSWRGKTCQELASSYDYMSETQRKTAASGDAHMAKVHGWQVDAIQQVRNEQGCLSGNGAADPTRQTGIAAYGYCLAVTEGHQYLTSVFRYADYFTDSGAAETAAFNAMLRSTYGLATGNGACVMEDSQAKAQAAVERVAGYTNLQLSRDTIRINWAPPSIAKAAPAPVAAPLKPAAPTAGVANPLGLKLEAPSPELVKALGLESGEGAWVVDVAAGSAAADAGIRPMDVILDVSGQVVSRPGDVQAIAGKMRAGYKSSVTVWRNRASRELALVVPAGVSVPVQPLRAAVPVQEQPAAVSADARYCSAVVATQHTYGSTISPVKLIPGAAKDIQSALRSYIAKVKQEQPGLWGELTVNTLVCQPGAVVCSAEGKGPGGKTQNAFAFCHATQEQADMQVAEMRKGDPQAVVVDWP